MRGLKFSAVLVLIMFLTCGVSLAQDNMAVPDLSEVPDSLNWQIVNRQASVIKENEKVSVYFNAMAGDGVAWLKGFEFSNGIIEADIKGKDVQGSSFLGIAFHGVDEHTYDAVYFRPFNFLSKDSLRKEHSVQYISHPVYTWQKLREEHPGEYENSVDPVPDPNSSFHIKIVVEKPKISVFVGQAEKPSLVVNELSDRSGGRIGLWVGNYSDGTFANLKLTKNPD